MNEDTILYTIWAKISALLDVPLPTLKQYNCKVEALGTTATQ